MGFKFMRKLQMIAIALQFAAAPLLAAVLSVTILDEKGQPAAARVYLTDGEGQPVMPPSTIVYDKVGSHAVAERHFVARRGAFSVDLSPGSYRLSVERGKEYLPASSVIVIGESGAATQTIRLRRWVDMARRGWYSGDMHVHRPLADMSDLMEAEELGIAVPITRWRTNRQINSDPELPRFLAAADADGYFHAGDGRYFPVLNEELEPRASALLASRLGREPVELEYPLASFGKAVALAPSFSFAAANRAVALFAAGDDADERRP